MTVARRGWMRPAASSLRLIKETSGCENSSSCANSSGDSMRFAFGWTGLKVRCNRTGSRPNPNYWILRMAIER
jgi:hypothetical protein